MERIGDISSCQFNRPKRVIAISDLRSGTFQWGQQPGSEVPFLDKYDYFIWHIFVSTSNYIKHALKKNDHLKSKKFGLLIGDSRRVSRPWHLKADRTPSSQGWRHPPAMDIPRVASDDAARSCCSKHSGVATAHYLVSRRAFERTSKKVMPRDTQRSASWPLPRGSMNEQDSVLTNKSCHFP